MPRRESIFVSYSHRDRSLVNAIIALQKDLERAVFLDSMHTPRGIDWKKHHEAQIRRADLFILFWSQSASKSKEVEREWRLALESRCGIIPVFLDATSLPGELSHLHAVSLAEYVVSSSKPGLFLKHAEFYSRRGEVIGAASMFLGLGGVLALLLSLPDRSVAALLDPARASIITVSLLTISGGIAFFAKARRWSKLRGEVTKEVILELKNWYRRTGETITDEEVVDRHLKPNPDYVYAPSRHDLRYEGVKALQPALAVLSESYVYKRAADDNPEAEAVVDKNGWIKCSNCGKRFSISSHQSWDGRIHLTCGQRIRLIHLT